MQRTQLIRQVTGQDLGYHTALPLLGIESGSGLHDGDAAWRIQKRTNVCIMVRTDIRIRW